MYTKKLFYLVALLVLVSSAVLAQDSTQWTGGAGNTTWTTPGNWDGGVPSSTIRAIINSAANNPELVDAQSCLNLTINSGGVLNLSGQGANTSPGTLTVSGTSGTGGYVTINSGGTINGGTGTLLATGNWTRNGTFFTGSGSTITLNGSGTQTIDAGGFYNLKIDKSGGTATLNTGTFSIGNNLNVNAGNLNAGSAIVNLTGPNGGPFTITGGTFLPGSGTLSFRNTAPSTVPGGSYWNLGINRSNITFTADGAMTVSGALSIDAGTFVSGLFTHNIKGNFTAASGGILSFSPTAGSTLNFNGSSGGQTIPTVTYEAIKINNSAGVTLSGTGATTVTGISIGDVTTNSTFNDGGNQIYLASGGSTLVMANSATLKLGSGSSVTALPFNPSNSATFLSQTLASGTTIEYAATANQNVKGIGYQNLTLSGGGSQKTLQGTSTVAGTLLINSSVAATIGGSAVVTVNGTLTNSSGSITLNGTGALTVAGSATMGTLSGSGLLGFVPSGAQTIDLGTLTSTGTVTFNSAAASTITFSNASTPASSFANLVLTGGEKITPANDWTASGTLTLSASAAISLNSARTISTSNLSAASGSSVVSAGTINITGPTASIDGYNGKSTSTFNYSPGSNGTFAFAATPIFTSLGNVTFGGGASTIGFTNSPSNLATVTISNTSGLQMPGAWKVTKLLSISDNATFNLGSSQLNLNGGTLTESGSGRLVNASGGSILFSGTGPTTWTLGGTRDYSLIPITMDGARSGGGLYIKGFSLKIGTVAFNNNTSNMISMGGNNMTLMGSSPGYTGSVGVGAHIFNGTVAATVGTSAYTFPVGDGVNYAGVILTSPTSVPGVTTVGYNSSAPGGTTPSLVFAETGPKTITVSRASVFYWTVGTTNSLAGQHDLSLTLTRTPSTPDPFQGYDTVRAISRNLSTDLWSKFTGTYANTQGSGVHDIASVVLSAGADTGLTAGTKTIAFGLSSAVVSISGLVYYGDSTYSGNEVGNVGVRLLSTTPSVNTVISIASGASTSGYLFSNVGGITSGYKVQVTVFPSWTNITGPTSTDAVEVRNAIVGRLSFATSGAVSTLTTIAADVDSSGVIDVNDVMEIMQRSVGTISFFHTTAGTQRGDYYSTSFTTATQILANLTAQNLKVIAIGDAKYTGVPSGTGQLKKSVMFANAGNVDVDAKKAFSVPVQLVGDAVEAAAFTIAVKYPVDQAEFKGVVSSLEGLTAVASDGYVRITWIDMSGKKSAAIAKNADIVNIRFQPKDGFNASKGFNLELDAAHTSFSNNDAGNVSLSLNSPHVGLALPTDFALSQNYPNPFNPSTSLNYSVPELGKVSIMIYNMLGQEVTTLFSGVQEPGRYTAQWNANNVATGVYIVRMIGSSATKNFSAVVKVMLMK